MTVAAFQTILLIELIRKAGVTESDIVVISIPAYFDARARGMLRHACRSLNIPVTLVEEPTAAALTYLLLNATDAELARMSKFKKSHIVVADMGGGTNDFTHLRVIRLADKVKVEILKRTGNRSVQVSIFFVAWAGLQLRISFVYSSMFVRQLLLV
jgi:molecular chaperone DnaK (HSP70)